MFNLINRKKFSVIKLNNKNECVDIDVNQHFDHSQAYSSPFLITVPAYSSVIRVTLKPGYLIENNVI